MFLITPVAWVKGRLSRQEQRGSALVAVLGVMAVTAIIGVTIVAMTVNALGVTSATKASVQSRAAAEAGIDRALVDVQGTCVSNYASATVPRYSYTLEYAMTSVSPTWSHGCPPDDAKLIKITSTGYAQVPGTAGDSFGDSRVLEAIYAYIPVFVEVPQVDPAVYAHTMEGTFKNFVLTSAADDISADVQIKNGNVICENGATIDGKVVLGNGYAALDNCQVNGSVHVSQYVTASGNATKVFGDVIAQGLGVLPPSGDVVTVAAGADITGDVHAAGNVTISSVVEGSVTASGDASTVVHITGSGKVLGDVVSSGTVVVDSGGTIGGSSSSPIAGLAAIPDPRVPEWTDIPYPTSSWDGYTVVPWSGSCTVGNSSSFWTSLANMTAVSGNILVDARSCGTAGLNFQNNIKSIVLQANITFIAWSFYVDKLVVDSSNATTRYLWFVVPDNVDDDLPTCTVPATAAAPAGNITLTNEADIASTIVAMAYTPCKVISDRNNWRGQLYGGTMQFLQQALLTYVPIGVPGVDFDASLPPVVALDHAVLGERQSMRELGSGD